MVKLNHHGEPVASGMSRGAPMGRISAGLAALDLSAPLSLRVVPINAGGYDASGAYWGRGPRLWLITDHMGKTHYLRAQSISGGSHREAAKTVIRTARPDARFLR